MYYFRIIFSLLIAILAVSSCENFQSSEEINTELSLEEDFELVNINDDYEIMVPSYMKVAKTLNDEASLQYQNIFKQNFLVVLDEPSDEFVSVFEELGEYDHDISMIENYMHIQTGYMKEELTLSQEYEPVTLKINGLDAISIEFDAFIEDYPDEIFYHLTYIDGGKNIYMIMSWTTMEQKEPLKNTFEQIASTFFLL